MSKEELSPAERLAAAQAKLYGTYDPRKVRTVEPPKPTKADLLAERERVQAQADSAKARLAELAKAILDARD